MTYPSNPAIVEIRKQMRDWIGDVPDHDTIEGIFYALTQDEDLRAMWDNHLKSELARYEEDMSALHAVEPGEGERSYGQLVTGA